MDEYNEMNFRCEPADQEAEYQAQHAQSDPRPPKKKGTLKLVSLLLAVALVGSIGGSVLTGAIAGLHKSEEELPPPVEETAGYQLTTYDLPDELKSNDSGKSLTPAQVYEMTVNSVVGIRTETTTNVFGQEAVSASAGSGFILTEDGFVVTNAHVVKGADTIQVSTYDGTTYDAQLVGADSNFDIAVLKIDAAGLPAVTIGDSDKLRVGEAVAAIGNPLGELTFTLTTGVLSAVDREINTDGVPQNMLQTNAAINSGNSGGPLFDMDGNVIGVTTAKYSGSTSSGTTIEGLGFAIPINQALKVAYDLAEYGYVKGQAYFGIIVQTLPADTAANYGLPVGPRVTSVNEGSCAEKAGMQVGDIILNFNGTDVANTPELLSALRKAQAGETVTVKLFRAGAELEVEVTLDERPRESDIVVPEQENAVQPVNPEDPNTYFIDPNNPFGFPFGFGN